MKKVKEIYYIDNREERSSDFSTGFMFVLEDGSKVETMTTDIIAERYTKADSGIVYSCEHIKSFNKLEEPRAEDLKSPLFEAIWQAIKRWDIEREYGQGRAGATGTDVKIIMNAIKSLTPKD